MAVNAKKANNSPIPREAIEGAAGINDKVGIYGVDIQNKDEKEIIGVSNAVKREAVLSTELNNGISIKAYETVMNKSEDVVK